MEKKKHTVPYIQEGTKWTKNHPENSKTLSQTFQAFLKFIFFPAFFLPKRCHFSTLYLLPNQTDLPGMGDYRWQEHHTPFLLSKEVKLYQILWLRRRWVRKLATFHFPHLFGSLWRSIDTNENLRFLYFRRHLAMQRSLYKRLSLLLRVFAA